MLSSKYLVILAIVAFANAQDNAAPENTVQENVVPVEEDKARQGQAPAQPPAAAAGTPSLPPREHWTTQVRQAVIGANERFSNNMIVVLSGLSETMRQAGYNNTRAFAMLTRAIVTNTVDLTSVIAYMPRLLLLDLPNQFTEVLQLIRRNEVRPPTSVNEAIDSILVLTRQAEESGITQRVFGPIVRYMPNLLNGIHDYLQTLFSTMFNVFGGVSLPDPTRSPIPVPPRSPAEGGLGGVQPAPAAPAAPAGRFYPY